jgi:hypothetical protein
MSTQDTHAKTPGNRGLSIPVERQGDDMRCPQLKCTCRERMLYLTLPSAPCPLGSFSEAKESRRLFPNCPIFEQLIVLTIWRIGENPDSKVHKGCLTAAFPFRQKAG